MIKCPRVTFHVLPSPFFLLFLRKRHEDRRKNERRRDENRTYRRENETKKVPSAFSPWWDFNARNPGTEFGTENGIVSARRVTGNVKAPRFILQAFRFTLGLAEVFDSYSGDYSDSERLIYRNFSFVDGYKSSQTTCYFHLQGRGQ